MSSDSEDDCYGNVTAKLQKMKDKFQEDRSDDAVSLFDESGDTAELDEILKNNPLPAKTKKNTTRKKSSVSEEVPSVSVNDLPDVSMADTTPKASKRTTRASARKSNIEVAAVAELPTSRAKRQKKQPSEPEGEASTSRGRRGRGRGRSTRGRGQNTPRRRGRGGRRYWWGRNDHSMLEEFFYAMHPANPANLSYSNSIPTYSVGNTDEYPDQCHEQPLFSNQKKIDEVVVVEEDNSLDDNEELSVKVYWQSSEFFKFSIRRFQKLTQIFDYFAKKENTAYDRLLFTYNDKILKPDDTPDAIDYSIVKFIDGGIVSQGISDLQTRDDEKITDGVKIKFQCQNVKKPFEVTIRLDDKLSLAMMKCSEHLEKPLDKLKFEFDGDSLTGKMVRNYKKKREKEIDEGDITTAVSQVVNGHMKLSEAASAYNIKVNTLFYRIKRHNENVKPKSDDFTSKYTVAQIFTKSEERMLANYCLKSSTMNYGLTYKKARSLAYEYATALKKCPPQWKEKKEAGTDWLKGFMKRHEELSLRKPENTSLSRSTSFNKHNVNQFFDKYAKVLTKYKFEPDRIYNLDETNIMTVVQAPNIIAKKGTKQVAQVVSGERGQLITMCGIANAQGNTLPPVFIFPRARFHDTMLHGAPVGSVGYANSPTSGWMTGKLFLKVLEHIKKHTRCTKDDPILILMDNHESHCTLEAINYSRENGIILLTFPPHCTHRLQPLDVAVNGPFKQKLAVAQNDWLLNHPSKTITIHDLASIVTPAYNITYIARNILSGFSKPGLYPFSRNAFCDEDFECAEVTNRPCPETSTNEDAVFVPSPSLLSNRDILDKPTISAPISPSVFADLDSQSALTNNDHAMASEPLLAQEISAPESAWVNNVDSFAFVPPPSNNSAQMSIVSSNTPTASVSVPIAYASDTVPTRNHAVPFVCLPTLAALALSVINTNIIVFHSVSSVRPTTPDFQEVISGVSVPQTENSVLTPEMVRPYPKAAARLESNKGRKKGKSRILTDTPEKQEVEAAYIERMARLQERMARLQKKNQPTLKRKKVNNKKGNSKKRPKRKTKQTIVFEDSDETDTEIHLESEEEVTSYGDVYDDDHNDGDNVEDVEINDLQSLKAEDFVLTQFSTERKKVKLAFVGKICEVDGSGFVVNFLKRKGLSYKFYYPGKEDKSFVSTVDVLAKLPKPNDAPGTSRTMSMLTFKFDFSQFKLG